MSTNASINLTARFTTAQRREGDWLHREGGQFQCHLCRHLCPSETSWWRHLNEMHKEEIPEFATNDALTEYRSQKKAECRVTKPSKLEQPQGDRVPDDHHQSAQIHAKSGRRAITKGIETLRLEKTNPEDSNKDDEDTDAPMADAPSIRPSQVRHTPQQEGASKRARAPRNQGGIRSGGRSKKLIDPEFDRSLPDAVDTPKTPRRLFDPEHDDVTKRIATTSTTHHSNIQQTAASTPRGQLVKLQKKENKRTSKARNQNITGFGEQWQSSTVQDNREAVKTVILKNASHTQPQISSAQVDITLSNTPLPHSSEQPLETTEDGSIPEDDPRLQMVRQPETRPISGDQLLSEVKGIYAGLVMVEAKCVEVDGKQAAQAKAMEQEGLKPPKLTNEQWQALIALHRTLLHEHHDFFLASQHPSASAALRRLAAKYAMPARMWRHGIHSFLELLRHRLPHSMEHMLTFIYLAYSIMALLYETVPAFEETWIECLGDLGRYRMAIEDDDFRDREVWTNVARSWYSKAADKKPSVGRLYHHIAILARPNVLQQLFFYCKSLTVSIPFASARESILSLFEPVLSNNLPALRSQPVDVCFVKLHAIWFTRINFDDFDGVLDEYVSLLDKHISRVGEKWTVQGCLVAVCSVAALYQYNSRESKLRQAWKEGRAVVKEEETDEVSAQVPEQGTGNEYDNFLPPLPREASSEHATPLLAPTPSKGKENIEEYKSSVAAVDRDEVSDASSWVPLEYAIKMGFEIFNLVLQRIDDNHILPHVHSWLAFLYHIKDSIPAIRLLENDLPWDSLVVLLNSLIKSEPASLSHIDSSFNFATPSFPRGQNRPLPEDWTLRGLEWTKNYFPQGWIEEAKVDDEERLLELPSFVALRKQRILWLAYKLAEAGDWLIYDTASERFSVHPAVLERIRCNRQAAHIKQETLAAMKKEQESDIEMDYTVAAPVEEDIDEFEDLEQSEELQQLRALKLKQRELKTKLESGANIDPGQDMNLETIRRVSAREALRAHYTVLVVDTNFMLSSLDIFDLMIADNKWSVVIPNTVMTELMGLQSSKSVAESAKQAVAAIQQAILSKKDIRVVTAKGSNVTNSCFYKEKLEEYKEEDMTIDDVIISITDQQGKHQAEMMRAIGSDPGNAQAAVLVTDDRNMRVKATAQHVPAIAGSALKAILAPKNQPRTKRKKIEIAVAPLTSLRQTFPELTEEVITNSLAEANGDMIKAQATLSQYSQIYGDKFASNNQKRPKRESQLRTAGAG
ncbi:hypothetical protein BDZ91DRAFT_793776 [Kalaharituber pfeilii]|nr:hypothetical protein BDZ91DRAFT_793776 [Kalaharituber pfeilii]